MSPSYEKDTLKLHSHNHPVGFDGVTEFLGRIVEIRDSHDNLRKVLANVKKSRENKNKVRVNHVESSDRMTTVVVREQRETKKNVEAVVRR